jgi:hypothetical protein
MKETHEQCKTKIDIDEFRSGTTYITQFSEYWIYHEFI